jgi:hypothetical protein
MSELGQSSSCNSFKDYAILNSKDDPFEKLTPTRKYTHTYTIKSTLDSIYKAHSTPPK